MTSIRLALALVVLFGSPQRTTLSFLDGEYKVTFDPADIPQKLLRKALDVSPEMSVYNGYATPEWLELCVENDKAYKPCGTRNLRAPNFVYNANVNLRKIEARIRLLDESQYPGELAGIVKYLRQLQQFWLWKETQRLKFYETGNVEELKRPFGSLQPKTECNDVLEQIERAHGDETKYQLAHHDWWNCVLKAEIRSIGEYPKQDWEYFLKRYKIKEEVAQPDD